MISFTPIVGYLNYINDETQTLTLMKLKPSLFLMENIKLDGIPQSAQNLAPLQKIYFFLASRDFIW